MTPLPATPVPDFRSADFLRMHISDTMAFYHPRCIDSAGGFFHYFRDDGSIYNATHRHLVSSTRFVFNYAMAYLQFGTAEYLDAVHHGLSYVRDVHRNPATGGYAWTLCDGRVEDDTNHCYGLAFVMLAYSCGLKVGIKQAREWMDETWCLLERHFGMRSMACTRMRPIRSGISRAIADRMPTCICARRCWRPMRPAVSSVIWSVR